MASSSESVMLPSSTPSSASVPIYDILTIGFGTTALSLAATLQSAPKSTIKPLQTLHLERLTQPQWTPGVTLPSSTMRTSFIDDLVTGNDPRSKYTFVSFLYERNLLVDYTNLGKVQPLRELVRAYLRWCGEALIKCEGVDVRFGVEVIGVESLKGESGVVEGFKVLAKYKETGKVKEFRAKKVISAIGVESKMPDVLRTSTLKGAVVHAAEFLEVLERREKEGWTGRDIAVIGSGQHAAEVLELLHEKAPRYKVAAFLEERNFRADEDTAFATSTLQTSHPLYPPELLHNHAIPSPQRYPTASAPLLDSIYAAQYNERIPSAKNKLRDSAMQIFPNTTVISARRDGDGRVVLSTTTSVDGKEEMREQSFDLVVAGTGYQRHDYASLLRGLDAVLDGGVSVDRDYAVNFRRGAVAEGCGVWVLGMLDGGEDDVDDALFRILNERSRRVIRSMFVRRGRKMIETESEERPKTKDKEAAGIQGHARL